MLVAVNMYSEFGADPTNIIKLFPEVVIDGGRVSVPKYELPFNIVKRLYEDGRLREPYKTQVAEILSGKREQPKDKVQQAEFDNGEAIYNEESVNKAGSPKIVTHMDTAGLDIEAEVTDVLQGEQISNKLKEE